MDDKHRFWIAVMKDLSFADENAEPILCADCQTLYVPVINSGSHFKNWGMHFGASLLRSQSEMNCYLTVREDQQRDVGIFNDLISQLDELQTEMGNDLKLWHRKSRPRIGFRRNSSLDFLDEQEDSTNYREAVSWVLGNLSQLVNPLYPRLQKRLAGSNRYLE